MKPSVYIDVGGTFTDCVLTRNGSVFAAKAPTTTYKLSVGFMKALEEVAAAAGMSVEELLEQSDVLCYSTTLAMNALIQRAGPKLALLTTDGAQETHVIGKGAQFLEGLTIWEWRDVPHAKKSDPIVPTEYTVGVRERVDIYGNILVSLDEQDLRKKIHKLMAKGVRGFAVCFINAHLNPAHEHRVREIIEEEYPAAYIGHVPVVLSSEVLAKRYEYQRTNATLLNAYLQGPMSQELREMADDLRDQSYNAPMLMVHNSGGMAEIYGTMALQTYNGGPVAGLIGSSHLARMMGFENVMVSDMGGTSFDVGLVVHGNPRVYFWQPLVDKWQVSMSMIESISIGAGGGSIAAVAEMPRRLTVGPQSAGSMPGPACYDLGGTKPTVTDADLILGYLNPDYYHGGAIKLNKDKAIDAVTEEVAKPLGVGVYEAASLIRSTIDRIMGDRIYMETTLRGFDPRRFLLFAYGGAGPTHCCDYSTRARMPKIVIFRQSPVFCAYGTSMMDILHTKEISKHLPCLASGTGAPCLDSYQFNTLVRDLQDKLKDELRMEGLDPSDATFTVDIDMRFGHVIDVLRVRSSRVFMSSDEEVMALYKQFEADYTALYSGWTVMPQLGVDIETIYVTATLPRAKFDPPVYEFKSNVPPSTAEKGSRLAYWAEDGGFRETRVYELGALECGNVIEGPAIVEAPDTTVVLPRWARMVMDKWLFGEIEAKELAREDALLQLGRWREVVKA